MGIGGGGGGGIGAGGADDQYNIYVNIDMKGAQQALAALTALFAANTAAINGNINDINVNLNQMFKTITSQGGQAGQTLGNIATQMHETTGASDKLGISLGGVMTRMLALRTAMTTIRELGDAFNDAASKATEMGKAGSDWQRTLRPVEALKGVPGGVSEETIQSQLRMIRMGATAPEALKFGETFGGFAASTVELGQIDQKKYQDIQERALRLALPYGGETESFAKLAGQMTQKAGAGADPEKIQQQLAEQMRIIGFGPGKSTELLRGFTSFATENVMEGGGGQIDDPRAAAALYSAVSLGTTPGRARTASNQLIRGVFGLSKGTEKFAEWSKEQAGVTDEMDAYQRLEKIVPELRKQLKVTPGQEKAAAADLARGGEGGEIGKRISVMLHDEMGIRDATFTRVMTSMVANFGTAKGLYESKPIDRPTIDKGLRDFENSQEARARRAEGETFASEQEQNRRYQERYILMTQARSSLIRQGRLAPETVPMRAIQDMATARGLTGDMTAEQKMITTASVEEAVKRYGDFFRLGKRRTITQEEIMGAARSGELTEEMSRAQRRWAEAGQPETAPMGPRGRRVVEPYRGEGGFEDIARDVGEKVRPLYNRLPDIGLTRALSSAETRRRQDEEDKEWDFARPSPLLPPAVPPGAAMPAEGVPGGPRRGTMERRRAAAQGEPHAGVARPTPGRVAIATRPGVGPERDDPREMPRPGAEFEDGGRGGAGKSDEKMAAAMVAMISHVKRGADAQERMEQKMNDPLPLPGRPTVVS